MKKYIVYVSILFVMSQNLSCTKESAVKGNINTTGKGGSMARFTIVGEYLYVVDKTHLKVFDVSNVSSPVLKSNIEVGFEIETIYPFKDKLFIGSTSVVHIFSIENPEQPKKLSTASSQNVFRRCDPVVAKDSVAFATLRTNNECGGTQSILAVYDIRNVLTPVQVTEVAVSEPYGLAYADNALYVCDRNSLLVFDITNPFNPIWKTQIIGETYYDVITYDNTLVCWVKNGIALYDISDRLAPQLITTIN